MKIWRQCLAYFLSCSLVFATSAYAQQQIGATPQSTSPTMQQTPEQLQQLLAPIALYPDALVAQVLAASTYPTEVVEADRWMQQHPDLKGAALAQAVDQQPWDPSVKALTQFPSVLKNMDSNVSWTSSLGDAYVNQPQDVLNAVQTMRQRALQAGNLQSNAQQTVTTQGQTIIVQPASPDFVYVPAYDPWLVYGAPVMTYPAWVAVPGVYYAGPGLYFGMGFGIGLFAGFGWGWHGWGFDWHDRRIIYNHAPYISHSRTFVNRHDFDHAGVHFDHTTAFRGGGPERTPAFHEQPGAQGHSGAFSGFDHGGIARGYSSRGQSSFGGGVHAGGFNGGGLHGGGHR